MSESSSKHHQGPATEHDQRVMGQGAGAETGTGAVDLPISTQDKANWSEFSLVVIITIKSKIIFLYLIPPSTLGTANKSMSCNKVNHRQFWMGTNTHSWLFLSVSKP